MKKRILLFAAILFGFTLNAQVVAGSVTMDAGYANQVFYKLSNQATNAYPHASWDVAFLRTSNFVFATRVNEAKGIQIFEASSNITDWATIDVANEAAWTPLHNSETEWDLGAIDNGSGTYGWGEYNPATHHVNGSVIFVFKDANTYRKFKIDDFFGGYTFTYATWNGATWSSDTTVTLSNATNPSNRFNYYSFENNASVIAEPAVTDWDLIFTKYKTDYFGDGSFFQDVTGVMHHPDVKVAVNIEPENVPNTANLSFIADINAIGYDWKTFNVANFTYTINTDKAYYVKHANGTVYRLVFASFAGSSSGVITFNYEDVTALLGTQNFANKVSFGIYPNPSTDKKINIVYDLPSGNSDKNTVSVYSSTGAKVYEQVIGATSGFFNQEIDLGNLNNGIYVLKFESGNHVTSKKIVLQ